MVGVLEKFGLGLSVVCMIHCLATPIAMVLFGGFIQSQDNHLVFDLVILASASLIMLISILNSESRNNSLSIVAIGLTFFCLSFFVPNPLNHVFFVLGSFVWFFVHFRNLRSDKANNLA